MLTPRRHRRRCWVAMIEHIRAVENLGEILQVKGLDAILTGL